MDAKGWADPGRKPNRRQAASSEPTNSICADPGRTRLGLLPEWVPSTDHSVDARRRGDGSSAWIRARGESDPGRLERLPTTSYEVRLATHASQAQIRCSDDAAGRRQATRQTVSPTPKARLTPDTHRQRPMKGSSSDLECLSGKPREPGGRRSPTPRSNLRGGIRRCHNREQQKAEKHPEHAARQDVTLEHCHFIFPPGAASSRQASSARLVLQGRTPCGRPAPDAEVRGGGRRGDYCYCRLAPKLPTTPMARSL